MEQVISVLGHPVTLEAYMQEDAFWVTAEAVYDEVHYWVELPLDFLTDISGDVREYAQAARAEGIPDAAQWGTALEAWLAEHPAEIQAIRVALVEAEIKSAHQNEVRSLLSAEVWRNRRFDLETQLKELQREN